MDGNKINIVGWYNKTNIGDESYKSAFKNIFPNNNFSFSEYPEKDADAYIVGGGDIVTNQLLEKFKNINKPKHIMSVCIPNSIKYENLQKFRTIIVRDLYSQKELTKLNIDSILYPDFTFCLSGNKENGISIIKDLFLKENHDLYDKKIAVVINAHMIPPHGSPSYENYKFENFCHHLSIAIDQTRASFIFIPFNKRMPWDDRVSNGMVNSKCKFWKKNILIYKDFNPQETIDIISSCNAVISTRLHSSIFSAACGIPFVDITHNHKNKNFLQTMNLEKLSIDYPSFNERIGTEAINNTIFKNNIKEEIESKTSMTKLLLSNLNKSIILT